MTLRTIILILLAGSVAAINGCEGWTEQKPQFEGQTLRVVALKEPLSRLRPGEGFEHDLLWTFAKSHGVGLSWKWVANPDTAFEMIRSGKADVLAGRWSSEAFEENRMVLTGPAYEEAASVLVCEKDLRSQSETNFFDKLWSRSEPKVLDWIENQPLRVALHRRDRIPKLEKELSSISPRWDVRRTLGSTLALAHQVAVGKLDCFVTDEVTGKWIENLRPAVHITREFNTRLSKTFLFSADRPEIEVAFTTWFQRHNRHGQISNIRHRYFGFEKSLSTLDKIRLFKDRVTELPGLTAKFKKYGREFNLPWELVAAVAYQESHWNNDAQSHTGVRGIMQLTRETARHLGVEDREDIEQSLWGGAKYLRALIDQQPPELHERERLALALAAYNVGWGHLRDVQKLAEKSGRSPFSFWDLKLLFPMLSDPAIADELEFGTARGDEPVQFTERVLAFYDLLSDKSDVP